MGRKNYLKEELSREENIYLKRSIMSARNKAIKKNYEYFYNNHVELKDELVELEESIINSILEKCLKEIKSVKEFKKILSNPILYKYIKVLSLEEARVLFYLFWEEKQVKEVAKIMKMHRNTVERKRDKAFSKLLTNILRGGNKHV